MDFQKEILPVKNEFLDKETTYDNLKGIYDKVVEWEYEPPSNNRNNFQKGE